MAVHAVEAVTTEGFVAPTDAPEGDGFSCRTQIRHGVPGRCPMHLAEAPALRGTDGSPC